MDVEWTGKVPAAPGAYWFYGDPFAGRPENVREELYFVKVFQGGNGLVFVTDGSFLYPGHLAKPGKWAKADLPNLPK